jgi:hypothetical protein
MLASRMSTRGACRPGIDEGRNCGVVHYVSHKYQPNLVGALNAAVGFKV